MSRLDLTNWIIHFIHQRNPNNDPHIFSEEHQVSDGFDFEGIPYILHDQYLEDLIQPLEENASAFSILLKIMYDGFIKAGWSFRKGKPTIYGPKAAVCFTEMPLYALIKYAKDRSSSDLTESYGIALLKDELFIAGARPVIYGLSTEHRESDKDDPNFGIGYRTLAASTGIGIKEQYRYVYTRFSNSKTVDWTHEREWRWADIFKKSEVPGLPIWIRNRFAKFSKIIILVKTTEEAKIAIDYLTNLIHTRFNDFDSEYNSITIKNTYILAIEELSKLSLDQKTAKLDDLPLLSLPKTKEVIVDESTLSKVKKAISLASIFFYDKTEEYIKSKGDTGICGFAYVVLYKSDSIITQALVNLNLVYTSADKIYWIKFDKHYPTQSLDAQEVGAKAAAEYLSKELGENFYTHSKWD